MSFQGFYCEYQAVEGLINNCGSLFRGDMHFILLNVKLSNANVKFSVKNGEFSYFRPLKKKKQGSKIPDPNFGHFMIGRGGQTNISFLGLL